MIAHLRGRLVSRGTVAGSDEARVVVDVAGIGYLVLVPASLTGRLPGPGEEVVLHTSLQVREDSMTLYGFPTPDARDLFDVLLSASGVGPKLALAALSTHAPDPLRRAIGDGDHDALKLIPGIGKKSAQRLVLELKDRIGEPSPGGDDARAAAGARTGSGIAEVRLALTELGYSPSEVREATRTLDAEGDTAELLRAALRALDGVVRT